MRRAGNLLAALLLAAVLGVLAAAAVCFAVLDAFAVLSLPWWR